VLLYALASLREVLNLLAGFGASLEGASRQPLPWIRVTLVISVDWREDEMLRSGLIHSFSAVYGHSQVRSWARSSLEFLMVPCFQQVAQVRS
jgi:hypothetical protein